MSNIVFGREVPRMEVVLKEGSVRISDKNDPELDFVFTSGVSKPKSFYQKINDGFLLSQYYFRNMIAQFVSWPAVTDEMASRLSRYIGDRTVADVGCGTGYLSSCLKAKGVDTIGFDNFTDPCPINHYRDVCVDPDSKRTFFIPIIETDMNQHDFSDFDIILMSWPRNPDKLLKKMRKGQILIHIGEPGFGCTGTDDTWEILDENFHHLEEAFSDDGFFRWDGIYDRVDIFRKK